MMSMIIKYLSQITVTLFLVCFITNPAFADDGKRISGKTSEINRTLMLPQTGSETVGIAFFKTAKTQPDLKDWAGKTKKTQDAPVYDRDIVARTEFNRLQNKFANYDVQTPITVHAQVSLERYSPKQQVLFLPYFYPELYFPYDVFGMPVAILAKDIDRFNEIFIPGAEAQQMMAKTQGNQAIVELSLVPAVARTGETLPLDGTDFYPFLTQVAQVVIWNTNDDHRLPLWSWRADWYTPKQDSELLDLFKK